MSYTCLIDLDEIVNPLIGLRDDWSGEIPEDIKRSTDKDNRYKVRVAWLNSVGLKIERLKRKGLINEDIANRYELLMERFRKEVSQAGQERTPICYVYRADEILNEVIESLYTPISV